MSAPPSSRKQRPSTPPNQSRPSIVRAETASAVAPKSEYLRNALEARRALHTPTPSPMHQRPALLASKPAEIKTPRKSPDLFADFALTEEHTAPVSPIRRRRPSDAGPPRSRTNRELTTEIEKLKDALITTNMRVELLKKNNSELQHTSTKLKERVEQLEPLEDENDELRDENAHLRLKVEEVEEELLRLRDDNDSVRQSNEELLAINVECCSHFEEQDTAVQEAADTIHELETEKAALAAAVQSLKKRVMALEEDTATVSTLVDGSPKYPSRVHSVDESRPSTSHFDSDYYSQSESVRGLASKESILSITPSEQSQRFLDLTEVRRRSARDLSKRMSAASLKALRFLSSSPTPEVPQIPAAFHQQLPHIVQRVATDKHVPKISKRHTARRSQRLPEALKIPATRPESVTSRSPTPQSSGLRSLYRPDRSNGSRSSKDSLSLSTHTMSPMTTARPRSRQPSGTETSPTVPSRHSSRQAHTSSSGEPLQQHARHVSHQRRQSESRIGSADTIQPRPEECASIPPPPAPIPTPSVVEPDLTEAETRDPDRWWRSAGQLNPLSQNQPTNPPQFDGTIGEAVQQYMAQSRTRPLRSPTLLRSHSQESSAGYTTRPEEHRTPRQTHNARAQPQASPATTLPYSGGDFLFNPSEGISEFIQKTKGPMGGWR
jgi:hypothetical protein